jgi:Flp pilus assembly protein TadG
MMFRGKAMKPIAKIWLAARCSVFELAGDCRGSAAVEFAVIVPIMLVLFFGTVELSSGVAVDRKVTLVARTISDLVSQTLAATPAQSYATLTDASLQNIFTAGISVLYPYPATAAFMTKAQVSEIYVDSGSVAWVRWTKGATIGIGATQATLGASTRTAGDNITSSLPPTLLVPKSYLIYSEVSYRYKPTIGYVMSASGVLLSDSDYTRPRQVPCVIYSNLPAATSCPTP